MSDGPRLETSSDQLVEEPQGGDGRFPPPQDSNITTAIGLSRESLVAFDDVTLRTFQGGLGPSPSVSLETNR